MSDDLFGDDEETTLEFAEETEYGITPAELGKATLLAADNGKALALQLAKSHGYVHCLLGHVTCPFTDAGEEALAAAWYQGRDIGRSEFIEQVPLESLFGSQFEGGM